MCYKGNFLYCISVQTACLVWAILNVVINALNLLWYIFLWGAILIMYNHNDKIIDMKEFKEFAGEVNLDIRTWGLIAGHVVFWFAFVPLASLLTVIFSILLCVGINNRRPAQVKIYLVYGIVITGLALLATIVEMAVSQASCPNTLVMFVCVTHGLFLLLVHQTYKNMLQQPHVADHRRLVAEDTISFNNALQQHINSIDNTQRFT